jgi:hypothetical protein
MRQHDEVAHLIGRAAVAFVAVLVVVGAAVPAGATTRAQLRAKELSLSNFPTGWSVDNSSSSGGSSSGCLAGAKSTKPKHSVSVSVSFTNGSAPDLQEQLATGSGSLVADYGKVRNLLNRCKKLGFTNDGTTINGTIGEMSFPVLGNATNAYAATFSYKGITLGVDIVIFRVAQYVGLIGYEDIGQPDPGELQGFVTEAVNKIEGKPTVTPTTF